MTSAQDLQAVLTLEPLLTGWENHGDKNQSIRQKKYSKSASESGSNLGDPVLKELIKQLYEYKCQICSTQIKKNGWLSSLSSEDQYKFLTADGHHIIPLAKEGLDIPANVVCVCPNCHRRLHSGEYSVKFYQDQPPKAWNEIEDSELPLKLDVAHLLIKRREK